MGRESDTNSDGTGRFTPYTPPEIIHHPVPSNSLYADGSGENVFLIGEQSTRPLMPRIPSTNDLRSDDRPPVSDEQNQSEHIYDIPTMIRTDYTNAETQTGGKSPQKNRSTTNNILNVIFIIVCCLLVFAIVLIVRVLIIAPNYYSTEFNVASNYSGVITVNSPIYFVNRHDRHGHGKVAYRYEKIGLIVSSSGFYRFECNKDNHPDFVYVGTVDLYGHSFQPTNLSVNRLTYEYGNEGIHRRSFGVALRSANYILVVSATGTCEELFSISITGPAEVAFS